MATPRRPLWRWAAGVVLLALVGLGAMAALGPTGAWERSGLLWPRGIDAARWGLALVLGAACGMGFVACRAVALARATGGIGAVSAGRIFVEGACVELVSWPGKVWADCWRYARLAEAAGASPHRSALGALLRFRVGTVAGAGAALVLGAVLLEGVWAWIALACAAGLGVLAWKRARRAGGGQRLGPIVAWGALGSCVDVLALGLVAWAIAGVAPWDVMGWHAMLMVLGAVSLLPMGLGVVDVGLWFALTRMLGVGAGEAGAIVLAYRVSGPGLTLALGAASHARSVFWDARARGGREAGPRAPAAPDGALAVTAVAPEATRADGVVASIVPEREAVCAADAQTRTAA